MRELLYQQLHRDAVSHYFANFTGQIVGFETVAFIGFNAPEGFGIRRETPVMSIFIIFLFMNLCEDIHNFGKLSKIQERMPYLSR